MRSAVVRQNDFAFGELSPEHAAAGDRDAVSRSLQKARNVRLLNSFSVLNRFGSKRMAKQTQETVLVRLITSGRFEWLGALRPGGMDVYGLGVAGPTQSVEGAPWVTLDEVKATVQQTRVDQLYVSHQSYPTQVFTRASTGVWSRADFAFGDGQGNSLLQPYYRYAAKGITMQPSATTGNITLTFSDNVLSAGHVGVIFRYAVVRGAGQEVRITAVTDAQHANATVLNELPPTVQVTVGDASGFKIGEEVKGLDTQASGFITNISGDDITILMTQGYQGFDDHLVDTDANGTLDSGEYLVGEFTRSRITLNSLVNPVTPAASVAWDEAVISPVQGYPGAVFERAGRLGFTNFPGISAGIALSAPDAPTDFNVGTGLPDDAMFEILSESGQTILHAVSAANLLILTDQASYYVPESAALSHETFDVVKIGPAGAGPATPAVVDEGVVYADKSGNRILALLSTGSLTAPWRLVDISRQASHLITNPQSIAVSSGNSQAAERYVFVLNANGSVAVLFFDEAPARIGWTQWNTPNGAYTSMVQFNGYLYTNCNRTLVNGNAVSFLERFDANTQLDCSRPFSDADSMVDIKGQEVAIINGTQYLGMFHVQPNGTIIGLPFNADYDAGFHFDFNMTLWPPEPEGDMRVSFALRHISRAAVQVLNSQSFSFGIAGQNLDNTIPVYGPQDDTTQPPILKSAWFRRSFAGYQQQPNIHILRPIPQPLEVLAVAQQVMF